MAKPIKTPKFKGYRGMTTARARLVKLRGHVIEKQFADLIGGTPYPGTNKKDVIDKQNNIHSVKGGDHKWQWFLYGKKRFEESVGFHGAGYFLELINSFPDSRLKYERDKALYKRSLQKAMRGLRDFLDAPADKTRFMHGHKIVFLNEALFHSSEVDYLTINQGEEFHIFDAGEVIKHIDEQTTLENSKGTQAGQFNDQKVIFKMKDGTTIGEIEMRNDSATHYRQVKFWMDKNKVLPLLIASSTKIKKLPNKIFTYGRAAERFKL